MNSDKYVELEQLLGGYLNQDWSVDFPDWRSAVEAFIHGHSKEAVVGAMRNIDAILARDITEHELENLIFQLGCSYEPGTLDGGFRRWLEMVKDVLARSAED